MKICHISTAHSCFDHRIFFKECISLREADHVVSIIINHTRDEEVDGIRIHHLVPPKNRLHRVLKGLPMALFKAIVLKADVYHLHDPELLPIGLCLKLYGKKVIYDIHELVHKSLGRKEWIASRWLLKFFGLAYASLEGLAVRFFDKIILAEDGYRDYYFSAYPDRVYQFEFVRNFPKLTTIDAIAPKQLKKDRPAFIYAGELTVLRGITEMIDAMEALDGAAELWLLGKWENEALQQTCKAKKGWCHIRYLGFKRPDEVCAYLKSADAGLAVLHRWENYLSSLPVKAFEYMACSLPMVMSNFPLWEKTFAGCAVFVDPDSLPGIVAGLRDLITDPEKRRAVGEKGRRTVEERYSWENERKKLLAVYSALV